MQLPQLLEQSQQASQTVHARRQARKGISVNPTGPAKRALRPDRLTSPSAGERMPIPPSTSARTQSPRFARPTETSAVWSDWPIRAAASSRPPPANCLRTRTDPTALLYLPRRSTIGSTPVIARMPSQAKVQQSNSPQEKGRFNAALMCAPSRACQSSYRITTAPR